MLQNYSSLDFKYRKPNVEPLRIYTSKFDQILDSLFGLYSSEGTGTFVVKICHFIYQYKNRVKDWKVELYNMSIITSGVQALNRHLKANYISHRDQCNKQGTFLEGTENS